MKPKQTLPLLLIGILSLSIILFFTLRPKEEIDYAIHVKPILNNHCIACHGGVKKNAGFSLLFQEEALGKTASGHPAIIPGDARNSPLIKRLHESDPELRMPYQKAALSKEEIKILTQWIDQGAKWGTHWAYQKPEKTTPPVVDQNYSDMEFIINPIDRFIAARLEEKNLLPNQQAKKEILARRVALDLTGLPPKKAIFNAFIDGQINYESLVDSLLSFDSFGEKWASWWLDLARYADSKGYEKDPQRSIWQYRDWVIKAFNKDLSFDQFTMDQLAGDLYSDPTADQLIATGFHRNTMNNDEGGTEDEEFRVVSVLDRVNTTFDVWQSTTMSCVQCHGHPYDPFKQKDYYQLMAFFNNSRDEDTPDEAPNFRTYSIENNKKIERILSWIKKHGTDESHDAFKKIIQFMEPKYQLHNCENFVNGELSDSKYLALWNNGTALLRDVHSKGNTSLYIYYETPHKNSKITLRENDSKGKILGEMELKKSDWKIAKFSFAKVDKPIDLFIEAKNDDLSPQSSTSRILWFAFVPDLPGKGSDGYAEVADDLLEVMNTPQTMTPIMSENPDYMKRTTHVFDRGNWLMKKEIVAAGTPAVINRWEKNWPKNRLGLARWIVSSENPLTSRTLVNRVWDQIFGKGLVTTIEDLGSQSSPPTHPALLDWLSVKFVDSHKWRLKSLIKSIVMSGTYRQSSAVFDKKHRADPQNNFYARGPKLRLTAEQIRDQALFVSGLLSDKMYGPGVMPPQPDGVWEHAYLGNLWVESKGEDRFRRAIYTFLKRTSPYPSFMTFDTGSREVCLVKRTPTNTPLQALVTMNDPVYLEAALNFAKLYHQKLQPDNAIKAMYEAAIFKKINPDTFEILKQLYLAALIEYEQKPDQLDNFFGNKNMQEISLAALTLVANAIMNLDEFLTHA